MQPTQEKKPLLSPILRWFMFAMILANTAASMYPMLLPIYMTEIGASVQDVGLAFTLSSVVMLVLHDSVDVAVKAMHQKRLWKHLLNP